MIIESVPFRGGFFYDIIWQNRADLWLANLLFLYYTFFNHIKSEE